MQNLTPAGQQVVNDIASRYNLSIDSTIAMLCAVNQGGGSMAQFSVPELGSGQWMQGGMTMVGDMFNHGLQATVNNLCSELANALAGTQMFPPMENNGSASNNWWPQELGVPFSSGAQNDLRYAVFQGRLAVDVAGIVTIYDTLDHAIGGVSQQQGGGSSLSFSSQYGTVLVSSLPVVSGQMPEPQHTNFAEPIYQETVQPPQAPVYDEPNTAVSGSNDAIELLEKLGRLRDAGVLTQEEFDAKKQQLLAMI